MAGSFSSPSRLVHVPLVLVTLRTSGQNSPKHASGKRDGVMDIRKVKGMTAGEFMATLSTVGREERKPAPEKPNVMVVDRWIDGRWVTKSYAWDGTNYSSEVPNA
jgi:hypothetical protein